MFQKLMKFEVSMVQSDVEDAAIAWKPQDMGSWYMAPVVCITTTKATEIKLNLRRLGQQQTIEQLLNTDKGTSRSQSYRNQLQQHYWACFSLN